MGVLLGMAAGMVLMYIVLSIRTAIVKYAYIKTITELRNTTDVTDPTEESLQSDILLFTEKAECISTKQFEVFQVLEEGMALAKELTYTGQDIQYYNGVTVLFMSKGKFYYDKEVIKVPKGKCVRQIGVYTYKDYRDNKTVPIVEISDK